VVGVTGSSIPRAWTASRWRWTWSVGSVQDRVEVGGPVEVVLEPSAALLLRRGITLGSEVRVVPQDRRLDRPHDPRDRHARGERGHMRVDGGSDLGLHGDGLLGDLAPLPRREGAVHDLRPALREPVAQLQ
jgi:hypothetical protein